MKKHKIKLTETEMKTILETINKTGYLGSYSDLISGIRKKMTIKSAEDISDEVALQREK